MEEFEEYLKQRIEHYKTVPNSKNMVKELEMLLNQFELIDN